MAAAVNVEFVKDLKAKENKEVKFIRCDNAGENRKAEEKLRELGFGDLGVELSRKRFLGNRRATQELRHHHRVHGCDFLTERLGNSSAKWTGLRLQRLR